MGVKTLPDTNTSTSTTMSLTLTEGSLLDSLDETVISRGGGDIGPQVTQEMGDTDVGFHTPGHVLSDPHANSTVLVRTGDPRPIPPVPRPNPRY